MLISRDLQEPVLLQSARSRSQNKFRTTLQTTCQTTMLKKLKCKQEIIYVRVLFLDEANFAFRSV